jgi:hypothetical protein
VTAYCVEHGRWSPSVVKFDEAGALAPSGVRRSAVLKEAQEKVWGEIDVFAEDRALGSVSSTSSLQAIMTDAEMGKRAAPRVERIKADLPSDTIGMIAVADASVYSFDLFSSAPLFVKYREKILRAVMTGAPHATASKAGPREDLTATVRRFLAASRRAEAAYFGTPGIGTRIELRGDGVQGEALTLDGRVVHMAMFVW